MSFVDQIITGHRSVLRTLAIIWENKTLLFYVLLKLLVSAVIVATASLLLGIANVGLYKVLHRWITTFIISEGIYILIAAFVILILNVWLAMIFNAALLRRVLAFLQRKDLGFSKSFDFDKGMSVKLFWWSIIFVVVTALISILGVLVPQLGKYYIIQLLLIGWVVGTLFVLPVLIKRNLPIGKAINRSLNLTWKHLIEIISAYIALCFYMLFIGFIVAIVGYGVAWVACYMLNVPFGIGLIMPFVLIMVGPVLLLSWYFATIGVSLPATLYHSSVDKLR